MSNKHRRTLGQLFEIPPLSSIQWKDVQGLLVFLGATIKKGKGSRIRFVLNGVRATFHRPHPRKEMDKGAVLLMRRFLTNGGIKP